MHNLKINNKLKKNDFKSQYNKIRQEQLNIGTYNYNLKNRRVWKPYKTSYFTVKIVNQRYKLRKQFESLAMIISWEFDVE